MFKDLSTEEYTTCRKLIITAVLGTDNIMHGEHVKEYLALLDNKANYENYLKKKEMAKEGEEVEEVKFDQDRYKLVCVR